MNLFSTATFTIVVIVSLILVIMLIALYSKYVLLKSNFNTLTRAHKTLNEVYIDLKKEYSKYFQKCEEFKKNLSAPCEPMPEKEPKSDVEPKRKYTKKTKTV